VMEVDTIPPTIPAEFMMHDTAPAFYIER